MPEIEWNFGKFLVNAEGHVVGYVDPETQAKTLEPKIQEAVNQ